MDAFQGAKFLRNFAHQKMFWKTLAELSIIFINLSSPPSIHGWDFKIQRSSLGTFKNSQEFFKN